MSPILRVKYFLYDRSSSGVPQTTQIEDLTFLVSLYLLGSDIVLHSLRLHWRMPFKKAAYLILAVVP